MQYVDTVSLEQHVADEPRPDSAGYASCSIRRPVVISGVEFEPTWLENENATVAISEPLPYAALATTHAGATTRFSRSFTSSLLSVVGSTFSLSLPFSFGGLVVPGASILAATSAPTFATASYSRRKRLPRLERNAAGLKPQDLLLRWIDEGDDLDDDLDDSTQTYEIDDGPAWAPREDRPAYSVIVSSPEVVSPADERAHVLYRVVTTFVPHHPTSDVDDSEPEPLDVQRRFSDFSALEALLKARFLHPLVCIPSLPPRADLTFGASRFDRAFLLTRARGLQIWLERCRRHPVLGDSEELKGFLRIEDRLASSGFCFKSGLLPRADYSLTGPRPTPPGRLSVRVAGGCPSLPRPGLSSGIQHRRGGCEADREPLLAAMRRGLRAARLGGCRAGCQCVPEPRAE